MVMPVPAGSGQQLSLDSLTRLLQQMPATCHWAVADENLLRSIARGQPVQRGKRGQQLQRLLVQARRIGLHWPLVWLTGLVELWRILRRQSGAANASAPVLQFPLRIFSGIGAGSEARLFKSYCSERPSAVIPVDQTRIITFAQWHRIGMLQALSAFCYAAVVARKALRSLPAAMAPWHCDFLTFVGMRIADYAYMRAWFGWLKTQGGSGVEEVAFLSADTPAFAVADLGLHSAYLQHGLIFSFVLPGFERVEALTADEAAFFQQRLPRVKLELPPPPMRLAPADLTRRVLIASVYGEPAYMALITSLLQWTASAQLPVCIRRHPRENREFWSAWTLDSNVSVDDSDADLCQAIERLKPRLVVSWGSTALVHALDLGIIPVTVSPPDDVEVVGMVYPFFQRCLSWPQDRDAIARLLDDNEYYATVLESLCRAGQVRQ